MNFLERHFLKLDQGEFIRVTKQDSNGKENHRSFNDLEMCQEFLAKNGFVDIRITPNPSNSANSHEENNITRAFHFYVEIKTKEYEDFKSQNDFLKPTYIVKSGSDLHLYWALKEPIYLPNEDWQKIQNALIRKFGANAATSNPAYPMQMPDTSNNVEENPHEYTMEDFRHALFKDSAPCDPKTENFQQVINNCSALTEISAKIDQKINVDSKERNAIGNIVKFIFEADGESFINELFKDIPNYTVGATTDQYNAVASIPNTCKQLQESGICPGTCQLMQEINQTSPADFIDRTGVELQLTEDLLQNAKDDDNFQELLIRAKDMNAVDRENLIRRIKEASEVGITQIRQLLKDISARDKGTAYQSNGKFNHLEAAKDIAEKHKLIHYENDFYQFSNGIWQRIPKNKAESIVHKEIKERSKNQVISEVLSAIRREKLINAETVEAHQNRMDIAVNNGLLNVETKSLQTLLPEHYRFKKMNAGYNPNAKYPEFLTLVNDLFKGDSDITEKILLLQEICGYLLIPDYKLVKKMFFFYGPNADNGKSSFLNIIQSLIGDDYFEAVRMSDLNGFLLQRLRGKHANIVGDEKANATVEDGIIKMLIGETDQITADRKHAEAINFFNKARLIFSLNQLPNAEQRDEGYFTRVLILEFNNRFLTAPDPNDPRQMKADPSKIQRITEKEKDGILNWMLEGLGRLLKNGLLTIPQSSEQALEKYKLDSNSVLKFVQDRCELKPKSEVDRTTVYQAYAECCSQNGYKKISAAKFYEAMEQKIKGVSQKRTAKKRLLVGIRLK